MIGLLLVLALITPVLLGWYYNRKLDQALTFNFYFFKVDVWKEVHLNSKTSYTHIIIHRD